MVVSAKERARFYSHQTRARRAGAAMTVTLDEWLTIIEKAAGRCYYCGESDRGELCVDHVLPLTRGGPHSNINLVMACFSCDSRKSNRTPMEMIDFLVSRLPLDRRDSDTRFHRALIPFLFLEQYAKPYLSDLELGRRNWHPDIIKRVEAQL